MEFSKVIAARHSVRSFKDTPVDREVIDAILDQTATAPSSKNSRSSVFMVIDDKVRCWLFRRCAAAVRLC